MMTTRNTAPPAIHHGIVESDVLVFLQAVIGDGRGLSEIHQLLDEAKTMSGVRARLILSQANQQAAKQENGAHSCAS